MAVPRFLADQNLESAILKATRRIEPGIEFRALGEEGLLGSPDEVILRFAKSESLIVVSHDVRTMIDFAVERIKSAEGIAGLFLVPQTASPRAIAESIVMVWAASSADEWVDQIVFLPL
ncbi:MAG TPA: DUF5615 family PIN-like protein [Planctomycetaceae bacterium]|jgi:hypothetical protein